LWFPPLHPYNAVEAISRWPTCHSVPPSPWCSHCPVQCKVPSYIQMDYQQILVNTHSSFVLQSRVTGVTLKGQMLPTTVTLPGASPCWCPCRQCQKPAGCLVLCPAECRLLGCAGWGVHLACQLWAVVLFFGHLSSLCSGAQWPCNPMAALTRIYSGVAAQQMSRASGVDFLTK
jgi:hypothetical protein